jgi:hypothetical protein
MVLLLLFVENIWQDGAMMLDRFPMTFILWPLNYEKLQALKQLIQKQLEHKHIEPSFSPWNSPVFVIKKKSGKWRLLTDLRNVNASMVTMGALQPGLPTHACIPKEWPLIVLSLQDCFDTISIRPKDRERFSFSIPSLNQQEPLQRYQGTVLPEDMTDSPNMC